MVVQMQLSIMQTIFCTLSAFHTVFKVSVIFAYVMVAGTIVAGVNCAGLQNLQGVSNP